MEKIKIYREEKERDLYISLQNLIKKKKRVIISKEEYEQVKDIIRIVKDISNFSVSNLRNRGFMLVPNELFEKLLEDGFKLHRMNEVIANEINENSVKL